MPLTSLLIFLLPILLPSCSTPFPYTTLFRSIDVGNDRVEVALIERLRHRRLELAQRVMDVLVGLLRVQRRDRRHQDQEGERSEEHTSELQSLAYLVCCLLLEKKK